MTKRAALYARASTTRQAENDISILDQLAQMRRYCGQRGWVAAHEFVDAGASARDDKRPELQRMVDMACIDPSPFDVVLVHSQSRFFRDTAGYVIYKRKLQKHLVSLVSMTQDFGVGPHAKLAETFVAACDLFNSAENAKHVTRAMLENARQGFWNGALAPFGYRTVEVEKRGQRIKKHLAIDEREAAIVRQIFKLFQEGDGIKGPMGIKDIVSWLNARGFRNRRNNLFYISAVHKILTRESYTGTHYYNRNDSRAHKARPSDEWVAIKVPEIVSSQEFERVQKRLHIRRPTVTPPRISNSDVLLTGLARCESCGGPLMLRTGTGKSGTLYRYYACASHRLKGSSSCEAPIAIPEQQLDSLVLAALADQLLTPGRLTSLLREAIRHRRATNSETLSKRRALQKEIKTVEAQMDRLYTAVADGVISDTSLLKQKLGGLSGRRDECISLLKASESEIPEVRQALSKQQAVSLSSTLKHRLLDAPTALKKRYIHGLVSEIVVDRQKAVISGPPAAIALTDPDQFGRVRTSDRKWRALGESNPSSQNENLVS